MMKKLLLLLVVGLMASCEKEPAVDPSGLTPEQQKIQNLLESAGYLQTTADSKDVEILQADTVPVSSYTDPETDITHNDGGYSIKTTKKYDIVNNPMEFVTYNPWTDLYPGALVQGGTLRNGVPSTVPIIDKRKPGRIYLSAVTGNEDMDEWYKDVNMRGSEVTQAMNELLSQHLHSNLGTQYSLKVEQTQSIEELAHKLDLNVDLWGAELQTSFGNDFSETKSYVAVCFRQIYFTMAYEAQEGFRGVFTDDITEQDLKNYTGNGNPICYVSSVSYGRAYVLLYESTVSAQKLERALKAAYSTLDITATTEQKNIINSSKVTVVQLGGDPKSGLEGALGDFDKIKEFLSDGMTVSDVNVGVPISYKINHLADNTTVALTNTLSYTFTSQEFYPNEPKNDIVIDIFNIKATTSSGRKISNYSLFTISDLFISHGPPDDEHVEDSQYKIITSKVNLPLKNGFDYPVFYAKILDELNFEHRIRIKCTVKAHHQTYGGSTHKADPEYELVQDFEYNKEANKWQPVVDPDSKNKPFESLNYTLTGASMDTQVTLNYRFYCDGRIYDYATDGRP
ncbi:MAG: thiol-activated cytolysin family protein [Prevotellaceae bacterium]|nr:thiol-activated cytolysin family protein [Prevotellaceae bacterium]